ncbi:MAG: hypothetical protein AAGC97_04725 [Planctomycetota bacterium]
MNKLLWIGWMLLLQATSGYGQGLTPVQSSDLSAALPPGQWAQIDSSVDRGLQWLAENQRQDGQMPGDEAAQPAITSFATMAFLSRGHMPGQGQYGATIHRAIDYVLDTQNRSGLFTAMRPIKLDRQMSPSQTAIYNHFISGVMLGEVYGMVRGQRSAKVKLALEDALVFARGIQTRKTKDPTEQGGWRYVMPASGGTSDLSVTGWGLMFLRSARNAEFDVPKEYIDEALDFIETCHVADPDHQQDGVFGYRGSHTKDGRVTRANTGSGMLSLVLGGRFRHPAIDAGAKWYRRTRYPAATDTEPRFYLATYYSSQAIAQVGGETWNRVFPQIARSLLGAQTPAGNWPTGRRNEARLGPCFTTSLSILSLTPAYQLLPIYQR